MADYRQVHTKMWTDEWFLELEPESKLLWIYLFSNKRACLSGLYDIPMRVIMFEAGLSRDAIEHHLASYADAGKAFYEDGWILMPKLMRYNAHNITSPKIQGNLKNDVFAAPNIPLKRRWLDDYNSLIPPDKSGCRMTEMDIGYNAIPDRVPDTVSDTLSDTVYLEQNNTIQEQTEQDLSGSSLYQAIRSVYIECFPDKAAPRTGTKSYADKTKVRMKDDYFSENWEKALRRATKGKRCHESGWFDLLWFLKNEPTG